MRYMHVDHFGTGFIREITEPNGDLVIHPQIDQLDQSINLLIYQ